MGVLDNITSNLLRHSLRGTVISSSSAASVTFLSAQLPQLAPDAPTQSSSSSRQNPTYPLWAHPVGSTSQVHLSQTFSTSSTPHAPKPPNYPHKRPRRSYRVPQAAEQPHTDNTSASSSSSQGTGPDEPSAARMSSKVPRVLRVQEVDLQVLAQQHTILGQILAQEQQLQPANNTQQQQQQRQRQQDSSPPITNADELQDGLRKIQQQQHQQDTAPPPSAAAEERAEVLPPVAELDTEQLVAQLFDAELQQRLQLAAAAAATGHTQSSHTGTPHGPSSSALPVAEQEQQQEREQARPGWFIPAAAESLRPLPPRLAAHVPPWAPLPPAQVDRSHLPALLSEVMSSAHLPTTPWPPPLATIHRLQQQQMQQLLEDVGAPTYGSKEVLVQRICMLLQEGEQQQQRQQQPPHQQQPITNKPREAKVGQQERQQQQRQEQRQGRAPAAVHPRTAEVWSSSLARQQLLDDVVDPHEIAHWLMEARATDVAIIDVNGHAGSQELLIVASGVSQQHTRACAEAIKWQLEQKMEQYMGYNTCTTHTGDTTTSSSSSGVLPPSAGGDTSSASSESDEDMETVVRKDSLQQQLQGCASAEEAYPGGGRGGVLPVRLQVVGGAAADWAVLEAGRVGLHVLTYAAREYYALDLLWSRGDERRVTRFKGDGSSMTKDITRHFNH